MVVLGLTVLSLLARLPGLWPQHIWAPQHRQGDWVQKQKRHPLWQPVRWQRRGNGLISPLQLTARTKSPEVKEHSAGSLWPQIGGGALPEEGDLPLWAMLIFNSCLSGSFSLCPSSCRLSCQHLAPPGTLRNSSSHWCWPVGRCWGELPLLQPRPCFPGHRSKGLQLPAGQESGMVCRAPSLCSC